MTRTPTLSVLALTAMCGTPALAEVTSATLWAEWQEMALQTGAKMTATAVQNGGILKLTDLTYTLSDIPMQAGDNPESPATLTLVYPRLVLTDQDDGTVSVAFSEPAVITFAMDDQDGEAVVSMAPEGFSMIAGGDTDARSYEMAADLFLVTLESLTEKDGTPIPADKVSMTAALTGWTSEYLVGEDTLVTSTNLENFDLAAFVDDGDAPVELSYQISGLTSEGVTPMAIFDNPEDPAVLFRGGEELAGYVSHEGSGLILVSSDPREPFELATSSTGGGLALTVVDGVVEYELGSEGLEVRAISPDLPFPVEFSAEEIGFGITVPMEAAAAPSPFGAGLTLAGLTISDGVWNMFDPTATLPRDPATLLVEVSGLVQLMMNLYDMNDDMTAPPGDVKSLSLDTFELSFAGASLTGQGAVDIDMSKPGLAPDAPAMVGEVNMQLVGANGLMDKLVAMGVLQSEDVMGARMMLGMFARPGEGADTLVSKIELTPGNGLFANGMQLQ